MGPLGDNIENKIFQSYTLSDDYFKIIEPAGRPFEEFLKKKLQQNMPELLGDEDNEDDFKIEEETEELWWEKEHKENTEKTEKFFTRKDESANYYALLGIEELFLNATENDIRKAYKRVALIYHPDKNKDNISLENKEGESEEVNEEKEEKKEENYYRRGGKLYQFK